MDKVKLEFISRLTMPDGKVIESKVEATDGLPSPEDFDMETKDGFLKSFDSLEKVTVEARNVIAEKTTEIYLEEISKKNK